MAGVAARAIPRAQKYSIFNGIVACTPSAYCHPFSSKRFT
jgi:hypothetical protein